jgi:hypothetical protein
MSTGMFRRGRTTLVATIVLAAAVAVYVAVAQGAGPASPGNGRGPQSYTIGLLGDMPYNALGKQQYPALLDDINSAGVAFSAFDGDLKAGGDGACDDSLYTTSLANFNKLRRPLVWVPGDNDWTDCWGRYGPGTGGYDPLERLDHERQLFASTDQSLGQKTLTLTRESSEGGAYAKYPENVRWSYGPVVYLGLNVQGSNDNYPWAGVDGETRSQQEIDRQRAEETARKAANLHWLDEGFAYAKQIDAKGVMVIWQADPNFNNEEHLADPHSWDAYPDYVSALRAMTRSPSAARWRLSTATATTSRSTSRSTGRAAACWRTSPGWRRSAPATPTGSARRSTRATRTCSCSSRGSCRRTPAERSASARGGR